MYNSFLYSPIPFFLTVPFSGDRKCSKVPTLIGKPYNIQHNVHVEVGQYGYKGLPEKWQMILLASGVPEDVVKNNPATVERVMHHVRMPDSLQSNKRTAITTNTTTVKETEQQEKQPRRESIQETLPKGYAPPSRARSSKLLHLSIFKSSSDIPPLPDKQEETSQPESSNSLDVIVDSNTDPTTLYTDFILIAEGDSGPMYAAKQVNTQRIVAIKKISYEAREKVSKIKNELIAMKMSRHPNIVEFIACYTTKEEIWVFY